MAVNYERILTALRAAPKIDYDAGAALDAEIALALGWTVEDDVDATPRSLREEGRFWQYWTDPEGHGNGAAPPRWTTSVDQAIGLARQYFPNMTISINLFADGTAGASIWEYTGNGPDPVEWQGGNTPVAILIALFTLLASGKGAVPFSCRMEGDTPATEQVQVENGETGGSAAQAIMAAGVNDAIVRGIATFAPPGDLPPDAKPLATLPILILHGQIHLSEDDQAADADAWRSFFRTNDGSVAALIIAKDEEEDGGYLPTELSIGKFSERL